jgi:hypothetical protein
MLETANALMSDDGPLWASTKEKASLMIESVVHAKNGLRELGLCGEGEWHVKEVVEIFDLNRSRSNVGKDDGGRKVVIVMVEASDVCQQVQLVELRDSL